MRVADPSKVDAKVWWASRERVPRWLDIAREYMERWVHQQHIRDAVGRSGQDTTAFVAPVIAASMFALPIALERYSAGTLAIDIAGAGGGHWILRGNRNGWTLLRGTAADSTSQLQVPAGVWWRTVTLGLSPEEALDRASVWGDVDLARAALGAIAIIA